MPRDDRRACEIVALEQVVSEVAAQGRLLAVVHFFGQQFDRILFQLSADVSQRRFVHALDVHLDDIDELQHRTLHRVDADDVVQGHRESGFAQLPAAGNDLGRQRYRLQQFEDDLVVWQELHGIAHQHVAADIHESLVGA